ARPFGDAGRRRATGGEGAVQGRGRAAVRDGRAVHDPRARPAYRSGAARRRRGPALRVHRPRRRPRRGAHRTGRGGSRALGVGRRAALGARRDHADALRCREPVLAGQAEPGVRGGDRQDQDLGRRPSRHEPRAGPAAGARPLPRASRRARARPPAGL
ncbi:MAG: hypothetical protein AVDCRST_MAG79-2739, partial [uncultured Thermoleophilia bacterium]